METKITFEEYLRKENLSENTITSYLWTVNYFNANYDVVSKENLLAYKGYLMEFFKPKTVNLRIQAINKYLEYSEEQHLQIKAVKVQQKNFLEHVISNADYNFLKKQLKKDSNMEWYFVVWYLAATGARVSELIQIKIEHIEIGYFDLYTKGGKLRRLYIPQKLKIETLCFLTDMETELPQEEFLSNLKTMPRNMDLTKRWFTHIHSATDMQRIFSRSTMILLCLPILWDTKVLKLHAYIFVELPANSRNL